jgi:hypothetical protein
VQLNQGVLVGIFWDMENIGIPEESQLQDIFDAIRKNLNIMIETFKKSVIWYWTFKIHLSK